MDAPGFVFDAHGVLFDAEDWRRWLWRLLSRLGAPGNYQDGFTRWDSIYFRDACRGAVDFAQALQQFLGELNWPAPQVAEIVAATLAQRRESRERTRLFPGVRRTLERLAGAGHALAVLSDAVETSDEMRTFLRRLGVGDLFAAVVSSRDVARTAPDLAGYRNVLEHMGLPAAEVMYVGREPRGLAGARAAGMRIAACPAPRIWTDWRRSLIDPAEPAPSPWRGEPTSAA